MDLIYLDNNATTRPAPEVAAAMMPVLDEDFGNPSSAHVIGQRAAFLVADARRKLAACLGADPAEIVFTSGGTESDNLAIHGALMSHPDKRHVVTTTVEHEAVSRVLEHLQSKGYEITCLAVDRDGRVDLDAFRMALREDTALVTIMLANNETGVLFPVEDIAEICRERTILSHTDAVQAVGKIPIDVRKLGVDMLSLSAHKFHGPKGVGALYARRPLQLPAQLIGGFQERDMRGGTENVLGIVGLGEAASLVARQSAEHADQLQRRRDDLEQRIGELCHNAHVIGAASPRLPNTAMVAFEGCSAEKILVGLSEAHICASGGSACHSGSVEPSGTLQAMGIDPAWATGAIRISLSRYTTPEDLHRLLEVLPKAVQRARR